MLSDNLCVMAYKFMRFNSPIPPDLGANTSIAYPETTRAQGYTSRARIGI
jgi:hypothetical protein